jgi:hypothetical protein
MHRPIQRGTLLEQQEQPCHMLQALCIPTMLLSTTGLSSPREAWHFSSANVVRLISSLTFGVILRVLVCLKSIPKP